MRRVSGWVGDIAWGDWSQRKYRVTGRRVKMN